MSGNYQEKLRHVARTMMTPDEIKRHVPIFQSAAWESQKAKLEARIKRKQAAAHERAVRRRAAKIK